MNTRLQLATLEPPIASTPPQTRLFQRQCACGNHISASGQCEACKKKRLDLQRRAVDNQSEPSEVSSVVHDVLRSPGQPLDPATRAFMEPRFGHDFSKVRVHTNAKAADSARAVNALAYTVGPDVVFGAGQYAPHTIGGRQVLAHELTHTIQQSQGRTGGALFDGSAQISDPGDTHEKEAETQAAWVSARQGITPMSGMSGGARLQRQADPKQAPPRPSTTDCDPAQVMMLNSHLDSARIWVDDAERKIADYAYAFASTRHEAEPKNPVVAKIVRAALQDNFHTIEPGYVRLIAENFAELRSELNKSFTYECEDEGCDDVAYVRGAFAFIRRHGNIHVCPAWFQCKEYLDRVKTLIHERAHQYPGAGGDTYEDEAEYAKLSPDDAVENADSYALTARQIYYGGAHGPGPRKC